METAKLETGRRVGLQVGRAVTGAVALVVLAAAISEASIALGLVGLDPSSYGWNLRGLLVFGASCALLFGGPVLVVAAVIRRTDGFRAGLPAVAVATAALFIARYYAYDPYYAPDRLRFAEVGFVPGWWIVLLAALALAAAALSRRHPEAAMIVAGSAMMLAGPTVFLAGLGH
jgi:hypothetical protein